MQVVPLDKKQYGNFHSGDSYILLFKNKKRGEFNVHFWLGKETSRDEAGVAAIKSVELDDLLGGFPVQYREVQEHESSKFMSYFKSGIQYLEGGVATGFKKVEKDHIRRLLQIKGARKPRVSVVEFSSKSMNEGDCFILDLGTELYQWSGEGANRREKNKAAEIMRRIRDEERAGRGNFYFIESGEDSPDALKFFECLGGPEGVKSAEAGGSDSEAVSTVGLYRVTDADGKVVMTKVSNAPLEHKMLDTKDCFILDTGASGVFVWVGKQATRDERASSMVKAEGFLNAKGHADWTPITRVIEGAETPIFKSAFPDWPYSLPKSMLNQGMSTARGLKEVKKFDVSSMHRHGNREEDRMPDDARGTVQIWRVEDYELVDWPKSRYGIFFQGDSYVLLYTYGKPGHESYIIYFWLGLDSTADEQGAAALLATKLDDQFGGAPVQQRVVQGNEPEHFLRMLKGKMIVKHGGRSKGAKTVTEAEEQGGTTHLYKVRGTNNWNVRCVQVELKAASLNSNDAFILVTPRGSYVWCGKGASGDEREFAKSATQMISDVAKRYELIMEGQEPDVFWESLGGKAEYASSRELKETIPTHPPRLFHCSNDKGYFYAEEIYDFSQEDLEEDDVMILDTYCDVFLWLGKDCNAFEKKEGLLTVQKYVKADTSGRDATHVNMTVVKQACEPLSFTGWFPTWSNEKWRQGMSFEDLKNELRGNTGISSVEDEQKIYNMKYSLAELQSKPPPEGVDPCHKERYLEESEFEKVLGMTVDAFAKLSTWKQGEVKKGVGLF